jgi:hypothetical protein
MSMPTVGRRLLLAAHVGHGGRVLPDLERDELDRARQLLADRAQPGAQVLGLLLAIGSWAGTDYVSGRVSRKIPEVRPAPNHDMSYESPRFQLPTLTPAIKLLLIVNGLVFLANAVLVGRLSDLNGSQGFWFAFSWQGVFEATGWVCCACSPTSFTHSFRDPKHLLLNMLVL